jgi:hypothetical protein
MQVSRLKAWRDGHLQIPQELSRAVTFSDDTITDQNAKIFGQYDHVRIYGRDYFDKSIGFKVREDYTKKLLRNGRKYCLAKGRLSCLF